jgi:hypothetical protein
MKTFPITSRKVLLTGPSRWVAVTALSPPQRLRKRSIARRRVIRTSQVETE